jgi:hypothetical protein
MNIAIVMPSMRSQNWAQIAADLAAVQSRQVRVTWLPVIYPREYQAAAVSDREVLYGPAAPRWIQPLVIAEEPGVNHIVRKQNAALDELELNHFSGWFFSWNDDNRIPSALGTRLAAQMTGEASPGVIVFSCKRGQRIPPDVTPERAFATHDLIAAPEHMRVGYVTGEQYAIHTRLLNGRRFAHHPCCDGIMVESLHRQMPQEFRFVPDYFVPFNALEPGRWDSEELNKVINQP